MEESVLLVQLTRLVFQTVAVLLAFLRFFDHYKREIEIRGTRDELLSVQISLLRLGGKLNAKRFVNSKLEGLNDSLIQNLISEEERAYIDDKQDIWSNNGINNLRIQILTIKFIIFQISMSRIKAIRIGAVGNFRKVTQLMLGK